MPCFAAKSRAWPGLGEAAAKASASAQRLSEMAWIWEMNCEPMMPTLIFLLMPVLLLNSSGGVSCLKCKTGGADDAGVVAELRPHDLNPAFRNLGRAQDLLAHGGGETIKLRLADATAQDDAVRQGRMEQRPRCCGRRADRSVHDRRRSLITRRRRKHRAAVLEPTRLSRQCDRGAGRERFPAAARSAVTGRAVGQHRDVPQFRVFTIHSAINLPVYQDRTADASAQCYHHERTRLAASAEMKLADGRGVSVVLEEDANAKRLPHERHDVASVPPRQRVGIVDRAGSRVHRPGAANTDAVERFRCPARLVQDAANRP